MAESDSKFDDFMLKIFRFIQGHKKVDTFERVRAYLISVFPKTNKPRINLAIMAILNAYQNMEFQERLLSLQWKAHEKPKKFAECYSNIVMLSLSLVEKLLWKDYDSEKDKEISDKILKVDFGKDKPI